jgi:amidase
LGHPGSEPDVDATVRGAAQRLAGLGAKISDVSIPLHAMVSVLTVPLFQSTVTALLHTDGCGPGREDVFVPSFVDLQRGWRQRASELPETIKTFALAAELVRRRYGWRHYAKAMNLTRRLRAAYDDALREVDLLLLPTTPIKAPPLPAPDASREEIVRAAFAPVANTQPFNHSHHPALSIPCGSSEGLPVGMMLVGRAYEETTLYRAAHAFEQHAG